MSAPNYASLLIQTLDAARNALGKDVSVLRLEILFHVFTNDACTQAELGRLIPLVSATALSRNLAELSELTPEKRRGLGLVKCTADPMNLRTKLVRLTPKGRRLVERLISPGKD